jgi:hypothetical protein
MIIRAKYIRSLELYLRRLTPGKQLVFGVSAIDRFQGTLVKIGFTETLESGESVLPSPIFGPISRFNAAGKILKHKNRPKETVYHPRLHSWKEWRGTNPPEKQTKLVDFRYRRYPQTIIPPPSIELRIATQKQGKKLIIIPVMTFDGSNQVQIMHTINLFLEIFGECQVFHSNLDAIINAPTKYLNWTVLPQGRYPWNKLKPQVQDLIKPEPKGNQKIIENRLETVNKYSPDFVAIGRAGFKGYIIFGFRSRNLFVLESIRHGNATYLLGERWEELSTLTKAEILSDCLHKARVVHRVGWHRKIHQLLSA